MEEDQNGRQPKLKTTKMEDDQNGRRPKGKKTKNERRLKWMATKVEIFEISLKEYNLNGRLSNWKTT